MKIAHVQVIPNLSGVQQVSLDILSSIDTEDNELFLICGELKDFSSDFIQSFKSINVKIIEVKSLKRDLGSHDLKCFVDLLYVFKTYNFDIIHTNSTKPGIIARVAARIAGCKSVIHTIHGVAFHKYVPFYKRLFFYIAELFSTCFSHKLISVNKYYKKYYPFVETNTIYNGVDFSKLQPNKIRSGNKKIHFAFLGRLDEPKNPLDFIEAVYLLKKQNLLNENLIFTLAGDGELKEKCEKLIIYYQLKDVIHMVGWISDKNQFFNKVDVLCQPSKWEAFGLVFVEAAYFEIPSIGTRVEGIPEVILDGKTGLLFDGGAEHLMKCMLKFIQDPDLIIFLGKNAKSRALEMFSKENMVDSYKKIYFG